MRANHGPVYRGSDRPLQLLVDIKNTGPATYTELHRVLRKYRPMLTRYAFGKVRAGAVTVVVSGDRPRELMLAQQVRYAFYDGRRADLGSGVPATFIPLISDNWNNLFTWQGVGPMPAAERNRLHEFVDVAHRNCQQVRFWATPDLPGAAREAVWRELVAAGVDTSTPMIRPGWRSSYARTTDRLTRRRHEGLRGVAGPATRAPGAVATYRPT